MRDFERQVNLRLLGVILARKLGIQSSFSTVLSAASDLLERDELRGSAASLAQLPDSDTPDLLAALVTTAYRPDDIRESLAALTRIGDKRVLPALRRKLTIFADDETRRMIAEAIDSLERR